MQHYLYRFGQSPPYMYSDMNGYGPFAAPLFWFHLYWAIAAIALAIITNTLWVRGTGENLRARLQVGSAAFHSADGRFPAGLCRSSFSRSEDTFSTTPTS